MRRVPSHGGEIGGGLNCGVCERGGRSPEGLAMTWKAKGMGKMRTVAGRSKPANAELRTKPFLERKY
ncbi:hypothetical protein KFK09_015832 [Dendrobium nobile]|uniref:Uncharacterized protein n=1 Tax=Dendrobium nobile TaxID=94219 RepID=A0A8T3B738_DENNO|nr:hypothetical protein KFK09_015832 [Dendrobium nobile]